MKGKAAWLGVAVMMVVLGIALVGCATGPSSSPAAGNSQADLLKAAGFRTHTAQDAHVAYIQTLPAKKVVLNKYQDKQSVFSLHRPRFQAVFFGGRGGL